MKAYPKDVQEAILKVFLDNAAMKNELVKSAIARDEEESHRQDVIVSEGVRQSSISTYLSFVCNMVLIGGAIALGIAGAGGWSVAAVIGGLTALNVIPPMFRRRGKGVTGSKTEPSDE